MKIIICKYNENYSEVRFIDNSGYSQFEMELNRDEQKILASKFIDAAQTLIDGL